MSGLSRVKNTRDDSRLVGMFPTVVSFKNYVVVFKSVARVLGEGQQQLSLLPTELSFLVLLHYPVLWEDDILLIC
jgi:hypothetical protein